MSIIIEIEEDEMFRFYHYYHKACFPYWKGGDIHEVESAKERHKCWECNEWIEPIQPDDAEEELAALERLDQYLAGDEEVSDV